MFNLNDELVQAEYRRVRLEQARSHRLVQEALGNTHRGSPLRHRLMARLGDLFVSWGRRLQARYGEFWPQADGHPSRPGRLAPNRLAAETPTQTQPCP